LVPVARRCPARTPVTTASQPARKCLAPLADRRVFGERLSGYQALRQLGATLETTIDLNVLGPRMASTVRTALGLRWVKISSTRTRGDGVEMRAIGWDGTAPEAMGAAEVAVPLEHGDQLVGVIECGP